MRLRNWLFLGYSAVLALATLGLGLGLATAMGLAATSSRMVEDNFRALDVASRLRTLASAQQLVLLRRLGEGDAGVAQLMPPFEREARKLLDEARALSYDSRADREALDRAERAVGRLVVAVDNVTRQLSSATVATAGAPTASAISPDVVTAFESLRAAALEYYGHHHHAMVERGAHIRDQSDRLATALGLLAGFTVLVGVGVSLRLADRLSLPMERMAEAAARVATGDFEVRVGRTGLSESDLVAQRFDDMTAALGRFHAMNLDRLVAETRRLDQVVAHIDEGLVIFDERGRIERVNPTACSLLGLDPERAIGQRLQDVATFPALEEAVSRAIERPNRVAGGTPGELAIGSGENERTLSWSLLPFSDAARLGLILALRDVTDAHQFERMRTDFVLRASHELRTPITGMRMSLGMLEGKFSFASGSREAELVETLGGEMQRLVNLINALLDLSRLYAGSYPLERTTGNAIEVLQRARQRFAAMAEHNGLELALNLPASLEPLRFDQDALDRVFDNLIGNAIRHTPRGGRIELGAVEGSGAIELWVRDSGEGIAHADRARVFEPFVQIGPRAGGVGLGLAMCREIARQHGGHLRLDSAPGHGSCFTLDLPRLDLAATHSALPA